MKILIDSRPLQTYSAFRGIGRYTEQILNIFKNNNNFYFLFFKGDDYVKSIKNKIIVNHPRKGITLTDRFFLKRYFKENNIDIFHSPAFGLPPKYKNTRYILSIHDLTPLLYPEFYSLKHRLLLRQIFNSSKNADIVLTDSKSTKNDFLSFFKFEEKKVKVVYPPVDNNINIDSVRKPKIKLPSEYILYTGGLDKIKNVETIVKLAIEINIHLVIAGQTRISERNRLLETYEEKQKKLIIFTGFISDSELSYLYKNALLFVFLSLNEGFGYPPLEALKCGTPSVVSKCGSLSEILEDSAVFVDDPLNLNEVISKTKFILENKKLKIKVLKNRKKVLNKYSILNFKNKLKKHYKSLLN